jgi:hypothetical protein
VSATRPNGTFNGTLHHKAEPVEYFAEQARRRPHRQRVVALGLVLLAPFLFAYAVVALPTPNAVATVTRHVDANTTRPGLVVTYYWQGESRTSTIPLDAEAGDDPLAAYPVGSTLEVHAYLPTQDDPSGARIPARHPVAGMGLGVAALLGAGWLWGTARRNDRLLVERHGLPWRLEHS